MAWSRDIVWPLRCNREGCEEVVSHLSPFNRCGVGFNPYNQGVEPYGYGCGGLFCEAELRLDPWGVSVCGQCEGDQNGLE